MFPPVFMGFDRVRPWQHACMHGRRAQERHPCRRPRTKVRAVDPVRVSV